MEALRSGARPVDRSTSQNATQYIQIELFEVNDPRDANTMIQLNTSPRSNATTQVIRIVSRAERTIIRWIRGRQYYKMSAMIKMSAEVKIRLNSPRPNLG